MNSSVTFQRLLALGAVRQFETNLQKEGSRDMSSGRIDWMRYHTVKVIVLYSH